MTYFCLQCGSKLIGRGKSADHTVRQFECSNPTCSARGFCDRDKYGREHYSGPAFEEGKSEVKDGWCETNA